MLKIFILKAKLTDVLDFPINLIWLIIPTGMVYFEKLIQQSKKLYHNCILYPCNEDNFQYILFYFGQLLGDLAHCAPWPLLTNFSTENEKVHHRVSIFSINDL